tara:strand:- start:28 stop:219 length:192 start_codon:yes stop_codon:yes gene_type:complete
MKDRKDDIIDYFDVAEDVSAVIKQQEIIIDILQGITRTMQTMSNFDKAIAEDIMKLQAHTNEN